MGGEVGWEQHRFHEVGDLCEEREILQGDFPDVEFSEVTSMFRKFLDGERATEVHEPFRESSRFRSIAETPLELESLRECFFRRIPKFFLEILSCIRKGVPEGESDGEGRTWSTEAFLMVGGEDAVLVEDREAFLGFTIIGASASEDLEWLMFSVFCGEGMRFDFMGDEGGNVIGGETSAMADVEDFSSDGAVGDHVQSASDGPFMEAVGGQGFLEEPLRRFCR